MTMTFHPSQKFVRLSGVVEQRPSGVVAAVSGRPAGSLQSSSADDDQPNYLVRRIVVAVVALSVLAAAAVTAGELAGAMSDLGGRPAAASEVSPGGAAIAPALHVAAAGDTLWSIADRYRGDVGRDRYLDALVSINGGSSVQVGQAIRLP